MLSIYKQLKVTGGFTIKYTEDWVPKVVLLASISNSLDLIHLIVLVIPPPLPTPNALLANKTLKATGFPKVVCRIAILLNVCLLPQQNMTINHVATDSHALINILVALPVLFGVKLLHDKCLRLQMTADFFKPKVHVCHSVLFFLYLEVNSCYLTLIFGLAWSFAVFQSENSV